MPEADDRDLAPAELERVTRILSEIDRADFELVDPPDDLWGRIAASVATDPPGSLTGPGTVVEYVIDADDLVTAIASDWSAFARENDAAELVDLAPTRTLWSFIDSDEVRDLWRMLVERVRANQTQTQVPLRCDAPHMRRWFEVTVTPAPDGAVRFRSVLVFAEERPAIDLLESDTERDRTAPAVPVCSWCGNGYDGAEWQQIEVLVRDLRLLESPMPSVAYGICPGCRERMSANLLVSEDTDGPPR